jgi:hypothetical protein
MNLADLAGRLNEIAVKDGGVLSSDSRGVVEQICQPFFGNEAPTVPRNSN